MSYDLYIGGQNFNATWNIAKLFYDHMPADEVSDRGGLHTLAGLTGKQAGDKVAAAVERMERTRCDLWKSADVGEPAFCAKYDAPNGWGSTVGGLLFLANFMAACYQNPRKRVRLWT